MKRLSLATALTVLAGAAAAHPSVIAHDHPHGATAVLGLDVLALVALGLVIAGGAGVYAVRRENRKR